jgi:hypothetical protein
MRSGVNRALKFPSVATIIPLRLKTRPARISSWESATRTA